MHHALLYRMHHIIPFSTFHFQTAMNLLFCVWRPSKTCITAPPQRKRLYQSGLAERRSAGPIFTAHSGSVPVRGAESGCLIPRDVDLLRQLLRLDHPIAQLLQRLFRLCDRTEQHQILLCDI